MRQNLSIKMVIQRLIRILGIGK